MADFGDGSDGAVIFTTSSKDYGNMVENTDYKVSGNYLYLLVDHVYNFTSFNLGAGTELRAWNPSTTGTSIYIKCTGTATISGTVRSSFYYAYSQVIGTSSYKSWVSGEEEGTLTTPTVGNGGSGGAGGDYYSSAGTAGSGGAQGSGYGGGGGGGAGGNPSGGNGGSGGPSISGGASQTMYATGDTQEKNGLAGSNSGGGSGAMRFNDNANNGNYVNSGRGGEDYGDNAQSPYNSGVDCCWWVAGSGGAGGKPGAAGLHFILKAISISLTGAIYCNGTNGQSGGSGSAGLQHPDGNLAVVGGGGGGAGGGGGGGDIQFTYGTLTDSGTKSVSGGSAGSGGTAGSSSSGAYANAVNGSGGSSGSSGSYSADVIILTKINIGDDWKNVAGSQINIGDSWKQVVGMKINIGDDWKSVF